MSVFHESSPRRRGPITTVYDADCTSGSATSCLNTSDGVYGSPPSRGRRSSRDRRRHGQERAGDVPEQMPVGRERQRVRGAGQDDELAVAVRQRVIKCLEVGDGGDAVIFAAHQQHRGQHFFRMHHRQIGGHVEISPGRNLVAELHLGIRQRLDRGGIAGAGLVAGGDRADHLAVALAHVVRAEIGQLLGAFCQRRRAFALIGEGGEYQPVAALRRDHGIGAGAQRAGGFAEEMEFLLAGLAGDDFGRGFEILSAAGDIGIARGAAGLAVVLMVHGPAIEAIGSERIHHGPFALARHVQIEHPRGHRRAVHEEQHRPRRLAGLRARPAACGTSTAARRPSSPSIRCSRSRRLPKAARGAACPEPVPNAATTPAPTPRLAPFNSVRRASL